MASDADTGNEDTRPAIRYEVIRILLQEECSHPEFLQVTDITSRLDEYESEEIQSSIERMDSHLNNPVTFWDDNEEQVCLEDLGLAESKLQELSEQIQDRFP